jgi:hypothetical protein
MVEMVTRSRWLHERSEVAQRQCSDQTVGVERFLFSGEESVKRPIYGSMYSERQLNFCAVSFDLAWRDRTKTKVFFLQNENERESAESCRAGSLHPLSRLIRTARGQSSP